ncbi:hypothetical protein L3Y34_016449 [Caenorhabditis briggsae]|uniref:Uncharacterized protein n=1 Tax=Caenorhabditis briggsae TaxID=6238 RepID=A0AAE9DZA5_CAEBR|nr:hypothetical protein L3Y34_016449 [Caenorhabditis briggsae]
MLNGFRIQDLKNAPFPPELPGPFRMEFPPPDTRKTLQIQLFTVKNGRGLGQILFELSSLFGIAQQLGRAPKIQRVGGVWDTVVREVSQYFPVFGAKFEISDLEESAAVSVNLNIRFCCKFEDPRNLNSIDQQHLMLNGVYFQSFKYFNDYQSEIRLSLTPPPESAIRAELLISEEFKSDFLICVHTKNSKIDASILSKPSDPVFTRAATDYLVRKYNDTGKRITVAVMGNDPLWVQDLFNDKIGKSNYFNRFNESIIPEDSPDYTVLLTLGLSEIDDMAVSRNFCDIFLLTAPTSSFGWWLAYLAKENSEVYYRDPKEAPDQFFAEMRLPDFYPISWNKLKKLSTGRKTAKLNSQRHPDPWRSLFSTQPTSRSSKVRWRVHRCNPDDYSARRIFSSQRNSRYGKDRGRNVLYDSCRRRSLLYFVAIAAIQEYKHSNTSVRQFEGTINETAV